MDIRFGDIQETVLVTPAIRASETARPNPRIRDEKAKEVVNALAVDVSKYDPLLSHEGVVARTIMFADALRDARGGRARRRLDGAAAKGPLGHHRGDGGRARVLHQGADGHLPAHALRLVRARLARRHVRQERQQPSGRILMVTRQAPEITMNGISMLA
ncbi:MAG: hypothetical protein IKF14_01345 [Atopobiaceae bacterium]|nr:hypothetical protein [Atopobiaceae bacterium]